MKKEIIWIGILLIMIITDFHFDIEEYTFRRSLDLQGWEEFVCPYNGLYNFRCDKETIQVGHNDIARNFYNNDSVVYYGFYYGRNARCTIRVIGDAYCSYEVKHNFPKMKLS